MTYNFHEVKERCLRDKGLLPVDINEPIEKLVMEKINIQHIVDDLKSCREKKCFGRYHFDNVFSAEFQFGVIKMAWFLIKKSEKGRLEASVMNTKVDFSKPKAR